MRRAKVTVAALLVLATATACGESGSSIVSVAEAGQDAAVATEPPVSSPTATAQPTKDPGPWAPRPLSETTVGELNFAHILVSPIRTGDLDRAIKVAEADKLASAAFNFTTGKLSSEQQLARVTDTVTGTPCPEDARLKDGTCPFKPLIQDVLMWLVVFNSVDQPLQGPGPDPEGKRRENLPTTEQAKFAVLIDAESGKFFEATTLTPAQFQDAEDGEVPVQKKEAQPRG